jgi:galactokinase
MLSEMFLKDNGVSRVHGGGFAGTIQAFVKNEAVDEYKKQMDIVFGDGACNVLKIRKYGGMKVL